MVPDLLAITRSHESKKRAENQAQVRVHRSRWNVPVLQHPLRKCSGAKLSSKMFTQNNTNDYYYLFQRAKKIVLPRGRRSAFTQKWQVKLMLSTCNKHHHAALSEAYILYFAPSIKVSSGKRRKAMTRWQGCSNYFFFFKLAAEKLPRQADPAKLFPGFQLITPLFQQPK